MNVVVPSDGANMRQTQSLLKLYCFFCLMVFIAAPLTDAMANRGPSVRPVEAMTIKKSDGAVTKDPYSIFSDPDGDNLSFSFQSSKTSVATVSWTYKTVNFFGTPIQVPDKIAITPVAVGKTKITITATDPSGRWAKVSFSVTVANSPPVASEISDVTLTVAGGAQSVNLSSYFSDPDGDELTFSAHPADTNVTASVSGSTLTLTPVAKGSTLVGVWGRDAEFADFDSFTVTVNNSRPQGSLSNVTLTAGGGAKTIDLSSSFSDPDGDSLTFSGGSSNTKVVTASVSGSTLTLTPVAVGSATISITADDGEVGWVPPHFTATVVNNAPRGYVPDVTLSKWSSKRTVNLAHRFTDSDGDTLSFTASSSDTDHVTVSVSGSTLTISKAGSKGTSTITVTANDGTTSTTVTFTAKVLNSVPEGWISDMTLTEGDSAKTVDLASVFSDPDGDTITFSTRSSNSDSVTASVSGSTLTLTPVAEGTSAVTVTGNDGEGTGSMTFNVTVRTPSNNPPTGSLSNVTLTVGGDALTVDLSSSFSDPDGDTLTFSASSSESGVASVGVSGSTLTITPVAEGTSTISVTADDGTTSTTESFTATVGLEDAPRNERPSNPNPEPSRNSNRVPQAVGSIDPILLPVGDTQQVSAGFRDPDGDALSYSAAGGNSAVSVSLSGNTVTITAVAEGSAVITVTATDSHGATATQTISVTVVEFHAAVPNTPGSAVTLLKVSGDNQTARINDTLPDPLVVEVRDAQYRVVEGVAVQFDFDQTRATLDSTSITDAAGQASARLTFGDSPGEVAVEVSAAGVDETVVFTATATPLFPEPTYIDTIEPTANPGDTGTQRVYGVAFSPDGKILASAHNDNTVRLWEVETRELIRTLEGHQSAARSVAFSPDGNTLASGGMDARVFLWESDTGRLKQIIRPGGTVWGIDFSPDGNTVATATDHGFVSIWDITNLRRIERKHRIRAHSVRAWSVAFHPSGDMLASSGGDAIVRLWNPETGEITKEFSGHEEQVLSVAFDDGNTLASAGADGGVRLWNLETESSRVLAGHTGWVFSAAFHPNGEILASTGKDNSVRLWDSVAGTPLHVLERHTEWGRSIAVSRGGILASGGYDNVIHLWDLGVALDDLEDTEDTDEVIERGDTAPQQSAELLPNFPNPFNPETWIPYHLSNHADVQISIYDSKGELVRWLNLGHQAAGNYTDRTKAAYWDGRNEFGEHVASGLYFYRLTAGDYSATRKMLILK